MEKRETLLKVLPAVTLWKQRKMGAMRLQPRLIRVCEISHKIGENKAKHRDILERKDHRTGFFRVIRK